MKVCVLCNTQFEEETSQTFVFPYGFKQVQRVQVEIVFCPDCEEVLNVKWENLGGFDR